MRIKDKMEKSGLKLNVKKKKEKKIMTSGPITSWQIGGGKVETMTDLFSWVPKSLDSDCSHEIKRCLLLGRKAITNISSSIFKSEPSLCQQRSIQFAFPDCSWDPKGDQP